MDDRVGQQLGNYRLIRLLGKGGFAEVYLGEHLYLKTPAAIKLLQTKVANEADMQGFLTEAQTVAQLIHPHIVRVLEFGFAEQTPYLVMDYAPGGTLRERHPKGTQLSLTTLLPYIKQVAEALAYAHEEKFIHRDVKPENMLVGRRDTVLLSDFGIALIAQSSRYQSTQDVIGTVAYMAPEQIQGKPRPASDQYSLGVVAYEWLSGERPFQGSFTELCTQHMFAPPPPLREKLPLLPPAVEQVIMTALAKEPKERFSSVQAFATALEQAGQATVETVLPLTQPVEPQGKPATMPSPQQPPAPASSPGRGEAPTEVAWQPTLVVSPPSRVSVVGVQQPTHRPLRRLILLGLLALLIVAGGAVTWLFVGSHAQAIDVHMSSSAFIPSSVTLSKGGSLKLINDTKVAHILNNGMWANIGTISELKPVTESGAPAVHNLVFETQGQTQIIGPFLSAGTFHYGDSVHFQMDLTVTVQ